jgi:site-specific DNA recombinase
MNRPKRVALYARSAAPDPAGIERQLRLLGHYAAEHDWTITGTYADDGCSGLTLARPGLDRLREDWRLGLFTKVLVFDLERLSRNLLDLDMLARELHVFTVRTPGRYLALHDTEERIDG